MKLFRFALAAVFIVAFTIIACSVDETPTSDSGVPPESTNVDNVCSQGLCATNAALKQECEALLSACLQNSLPENEEECVGAAWIKCNG
jgi:hypothetical protein